MKENARKIEEEGTTREGAVNGRKQHTISIPLFGSIMEDREQVRDVIDTFLHTTSKRKKRETAEKKEKKKKK